MNFKIPPWAHQLEAIERAKSLPGFGLFFEMGTGKTGTTINILRDKFNTHKRILRTVIFCPPIVIRNWKDEWLKHSAVDPAQIILLEGSGAYRLEKFRAHEGAIYVTNYESLLMPKLFSEMQKWKPEVLVFDESHKCKSHNAQRSKKASELANPLTGCAPYKYILTGSPVLNSPMDLFQQYKILDGGRTFTGNFFAFRNKYFIDKNLRWKGQPNYFPKWEIQAPQLSEINRLLFQTAMRVEKKDCLDLPPLVRTMIKVKMTPDQGRIYNELAKDYISFVGESSVSATLAIVKALRLMQVASGFVSLDGLGEEGDPVTKRLNDTPKLEALRELLVELTPTAKILVWAVWRENYAAIRALLHELKIEHVEVHGSIPSSVRADNVHRFNTEDRCRVFLGHPGSGGIGINLVAASYSIFYSRTFSLEHSLQAEARNHRGGSKEMGHEKITRIDLVCGDTIDEEVVTRLLQKEQISADTLKPLVKRK